MTEPLIFYGQITYSSEYEGTKRCIDIVAPYVDYAIIVVEKQRPFTEEQREELLKYGNVIILEEEYKDNHPEFRNNYLRKAKEIAKGRPAYMLVSDTDEFFNDKLMKDLRKIVNWMEENGYDIAGINCRERFEIHEWWDEHDKLKEIPWRARDSDFFKNLLFKIYPDVWYEGVGLTKNMHETFTRKQWRAIKLDKEKYWYEHVKSTAKVWRNAARNFFIGGGGDNVGELNPYWKPFRELCAKYNIHTWKDFEEAIGKGLPEEIEQKLVEFLRVEPTDYGTEMRETAKYYFLLHPDKITPEIEEKIKNPPKMTPEIEVEHYVRQCYFMILNRHPDRPGLEYYKWAILEGQIKKEDLPKILMQSPEFLQKAGKVRQDEELVSVQVPVDVQVRLSDDLLIKALMNSKTWSRLVDKLRLADKFLAYLAIQRKVETGGRGDDSQPVESFEEHVRRIKEYIPAGRMLEIGAGAGDETYALMQAGYEVTGITFGEDNIRLAKERYGITLHEVDMHNLPFPKDFFDSAVIIHTLEHALAPMMVIGELRYVLKDYGRVYVAVPSPESDDMWTIWHTNLWYKDQIIRYFEYWGFRLVKQWDYEFVFEKLPDGEFKNWDYIKWIYKERDKYESNTGSS